MSLTALAASASPVAFAFAMSTALRRPKEADSAALAAWSFADAACTSSGLPVILSACWSVAAASFVTAVALAAASDAFAAPASTSAALLSLLLPLLPLLPPLPLPLPLLPLPLLPLPLPLPLLMPEAEDPLPDKRDAGDDPVPEKDERRKARERKMEKEDEKGVAALGYKLRLLSCEETYQVPIHGQLIIIM